jgi:hypothetical protein
MRASCVDNLFAIKTELTIYLLSDTYCALVILDLWHQLDSIVKTGFKHLLFSGVRVRRRM